MNNGNIQTYKIIFFKKMKESNLEEYNNELSGKPVTAIKNKLNGI